VKTGLTVAALLASAVVILQPSYAAFTGSTSNPANSWSAGTVTLSDDDGGGTPATGTAMFTPTNLKAADTGSHCIKVTFGGSFSAPGQAVRLYVDPGVTIGGTGLQTYLNLTIEQDTTGGGGGSYSSCTGFNGGTYIYSRTVPTASNGTLDYFITNKNSWANGVGTWQPTLAAPTATYRFTYTVVSDDNAQNLIVSAVKFKWEAHSS
jgi:hypothetical protein